MHKDTQESDQHNQYAEAYSEPNEISNLKNFVKTVNGFKPLTIFAEISVLNLRLWFYFRVLGLL